MKKRVSTFEIRDLLPIGFTFIAAGIGVAYGLDVLGDIKTDFWTANTQTSTCNVTGNVLTGCDADTNATVDAIDGVAKIPEKLPLIATVVVAAVIIGILVRYLMVRFT